MLAINENNFLLVSGGEDTTIRLCSIDFRLETTKFNSLNNLKSHLSSVRCVKAYKMGANNYLMVSAGGRAQIIVWKLKIEPLFDYFDVRCFETDSYYKSLDENESEIRIMDLVLIKVENGYVLITVCSDGTIRCYKVTNELKIQYLNSVNYALKCIIKLEYVNVSDRKIIVTMATDGKLVFWDFTNYLNDFSKSNLSPFFSLPAHQSGVNSFSFKKLDKDLVLFVTGGDDNAVVFNLVSFNNRLKKVELLAKYCNTQSHGAQVTGVCIFNDIVITTSIDQNVTVFKYIVKDCSNLDVCVISNYSSVIADVQGMNCLRIDDCIYCCLFGKGIEILKVICT